MKTILSGALFFIAGAASASFITYKVVEKKFKNIADEEIESVKAIYEQKMKGTKLDEEKMETPEEIDLSKTDGVSYSKQNPYSSLVSNLGYSNIKEEEHEEMVDDNIQVIPPEDFGEYEDKYGNPYKCESLYYYKDKVLAYTNDEKIEDVSKLIGTTALHTFGEYEDDSVFVRNHAMKTDFEILKDDRTYSEVVLGDSTDDVED